MKEIIINGRTFRVIKKNTAKGQVIHHIALSKCNTYYWYDNIDEAYEKPSITKKEIWLDWVRWFDGIKGEHKEIWIPSRNIFHFSIAFRFVSPTGYRFNGYITKARCEVVIYE